MKKMIINKYQFNVVLLVMIQVILFIVLLNCDLIINGFALSKIISIILLFVLPVLNVLFLVKLINNAKTIAEKIIFSVVSIPIYLPLICFVFTLVTKFHKGNNL